MIQLNSTSSQVQAKRTNLVFSLVFDLGKKCGCCSLLPQTLPVAQRMLMEQRATTTLSDAVAVTGQLFFFLGQGAQDGLFYRAKGLHLSIYLPIARERNTFPRVLMKSEHKLSLPDLELTFLILFSVPLPIGLPTSPNSTNSWCEEQSGFKDALQF